MASTDFGLWKDFFGNSGVGGGRARARAGLLIVGGRWLLLFSCFLLSPFFCLKWDIIPCLHMFDTC